MESPVEHIVTFERARREGSHVLISMEGPSGSGKTYSAILLGRGLVGPNGKLGLLDTETGRGKYYANLADGYDYGELTPPFTPERYIAAIKSAEAAGLQCLIVDSGSHEWAGIGGLIEIADSGTSSNGKALTGLVKWAKPKARHKRFMQTLLTTRMHLIICLRAKEKLVQRKGADGKEEIVSVGWVPEQDKSFGYEMTARLFFPESSKGIPELTKCPADLLGAFPAGGAVSVDTGARIAEWVHGGVPVDAEFVALKREAEEAAEGGAAPLAALWQRLTPTQRKKIASIGPNLRSIADAADRDASEPGDEEEGAIPSFGNGGARTEQSTSTEF